MKQINLGIVISSDGSQWTGGLEYYINLLRAIQAANSSKKIKMVGLIMPGLNVTQVERLREFFEEVYFLKQQTTLQKAYEYLKDKKIARLFSSFIKSPVESAMLRQKLDVVFAPFELAEYIRLPTITWFADFQHVYFPDFFPDAEVANRNRVFEKAGARAKVIILSSEAAFADFEKFFPAYASKARVLKFVAHLPDEALTGNTERVVKRYNLPNKFYYLPNQFWMHKNHQVVLDALEICIKKNPEICVVCSGNIFEYRNPTFPSYLIAEISKKGLRANFVVLGLIDRPDVYALMRQCQAVLQPSLFEGWSTTIEEAKSLGKKMILSDIPVHREQNPSQSFYFPPKDAQRLADLLIEEWNAPMKVERMGFTKEKLLFDLEERMSEYGAKFIQCVELALKS